MHEGGQLEIGRTDGGRTFAVDIFGLPGILIGGATGQGKSVALHAIISGLISRSSSEDVRLLLVDCKRVEFSEYNTLPHLLVPVLSDVKKFPFSLRFLIVEAERRLARFAECGWRDFSAYNRQMRLTGEDVLPRVFFVVDELAPYMSAAGESILTLLNKLAILGPLTGIHLILSTQLVGSHWFKILGRMADYGRLAFRMSSKTDSKVFLGEEGAERLKGDGDALYKPPVGSAVHLKVRSIDSAQIRAIVQQHGVHDWLEEGGLLADLEKIKKDDEIVESTEKTIGEASPPSGADDTCFRERVPDLFRRAIRVMYDTNRASTSHFQRKLGIGYNHACRVIDWLDEIGAIGPAMGAGPREILLTESQLMEKLEKSETCR